MVGKKYKSIKKQGDGDNKDEDKHPAVIPSSKTCAQTY